MKKKILSLVLVVAMLASMLVFAPSVGAAAAGTTAEISVGKVTATAGGSVDVDIVVTSTEPVYAFNFAVDYDKTKLSLPEKNAVTFDAGGAGQPDASGAENAAYAQTSPYRFIAWTTTDVSNPADATNGWVAATLHFDVAEDAIGDVVVSVCNTPVTFISRSAVADDNQAVETLTFKSGAITILPEGYVALPAIDDSQWSFADGVLKGCNDASLAAYTGTFAVPATINGQTVTTIGQGAFEEYKFSTVIIPATVETIKTAAFNTCSNMTKVYILGATTVLEEMSVGWDVAFKDGTINSKKSWVSTDKDDNVITSIYGVAGSPAQEYAETGDEDAYFFPFVAEGVNSVTFNGNTYLTGANVKAPGMAVIGDETVIGWTANGVTYAPGAAMTVNGAVTLDPVTIKTPKMNTEVGFMLTDKITTSRMRYTTNMTVADYNTLASLGTVTLGTIITPAKYVSMAGGLTKEALTQLAIDNVDKIGALPDGKTGAGLTYIDVPASAANPFGKTADIYTFAGSLAGFKAENIDLAYAAAFYATVELADGSSFTIYSAFDFGANRAVGATVEAAKAKAETKELKKAYDDLIEMIKANTSTAN